MDHLPHNLIQILWNVGMHKQISWNGNLMKTNVGCGNADVIVCLECIILSIAISICLSPVNTHTYSIHTQVQSRLYLPNHMHFPLHFHAFSARGTLQPSERRQSPYMLLQYTVHNQSDNSYSALQLQFIDKISVVLSLMALVS